MQIFQIIGRQNSGKTRLTAKIIHLLCQRGLNVGSIKHSSHDHELDKKGKDSHQHRIAGAAPAAVVTGSMSAVYFPARKKITPQTLIDTLYRDLDLVIIEGWVSGPYPKIEVIRPEICMDPLYPTVHTVTAVACAAPVPEQISDALVSEKIPVFSPEEVEQIADHMLG